MEKTLKQAIKEEYKKCYSDPMYFMKKYVKIQHQTRGIIPFELFEFQEKTLEDFIQYDRNIVLKSRQMGISTLVAAYSLWIMIFNPGKNVLILSTVQSAAKEIVSKIRLANTHLPTWLKSPTVEDNRLSLKLKNESRVLAASSAADSARGYSSYLLVMDECAFIDNAEEVWTSAQQTMATGGRAILLSTPNGTGNFFHKTWMDAESQRNTFNTIRLKWNVHPERNQEWRDRQTKELGEKKAAQECDTDFLTSGNTVIDAAIIEEFKKTTIKDPLEMRGIEKGYWIWEYPNYSKNYIVSADVARGDATDFSAFHIFDVETMEQVAEYQGQPTTTEYGNILIAAATEYNNALLIVENANVGWATLQVIIDRKYPNTFYSSADLQYVDIERQMTTKYNAMERKMVPGFTTTIRTRPLIISRLEMYIREKSVTPRSVRLMNELSTFIWNNGKAEAMSGHNDDLVMSFGMGLWVRDTALRLKQQGNELTRYMVDGLQRTGTNIDPVYKTSHIKAEDSWKMHIGKSGTDKKETLTWLL